MQEKKIKLIRKARRTARVRKTILSLKNRPRLTVFRSNKSIYAQIIDDSKAKTLVSASDKELLESKGMTKTQKAQALGKIVAEKAKEKKIKEVVFDKGSYRYHGRVKTFADSAREGGLSF